MLTYNPIVSGLLALAAFSLSTLRVRGNWRLSLPDRPIGAHSERAAARDGDGSWTYESIQFRRALCLFRSL